MLLDGHFLNPICSCSIMTTTMMMVAAVAAASYFPYYSQQTNEECSISHTHPRIAAALHGSKGFTLVKLGRFSYVQRTHCLTFLTSILWFIRSRRVALRVALRLLLLQLWLMWRELLYLLVFLVKLITIDLPLSIIRREWLELWIAVVGQ